MTNPFDRDNHPNVTPNCIVVGSFIGWKLDLDFAASDYSLQYVLNPVGATDNTGEITIDGTEVDLTDDTYWVFEVDTAASTAYALTKDAEYKWDLMLTQTASGNRTAIQSGFINIFTSTSDRRSHAEIMLSQINALLEGRAKSDVSSYSIKSRSLTKLSIEELVMWRDYYIGEVKRTGGTNDMTAGNNSGVKRNTVQVRFVDDCH